MTPYRYETNSYAKDLLFQCQVGIISHYLTSKENDSTCSAEERAIHQELRVVLYEFDELNALYIKEIKRVEEHWGIAGEKKEICSTAPLYRDRPIIHPDLLTREQWYMEQRTIPDIILSKIPDIAKEVSPVYLADHPESFATDRAAGVFASFEEFHSVWLRYCADESLECPKQRMQALVTEKYIEKYQFSPTQQRDSMLSKSPTSSRFR
ncbi:MAG: hypothetical protein NTU48_00895 [Legionellales bacterium]|nr:hypothetical protein [Legionellales bacterium]